MESTSSTPSPLPIHITDLYEVEVNHDNESEPFVTRIKLHSPKGEIVRLQAVVDDGAMVNAIDEMTFQNCRHRLNTLKPSSRILRMANGTLIPSIGIWSGTMDWHDVHTTVEFEVFPSGGSWTTLIGKPLLKHLRAIHAYETDLITVPTGNSTVVIANEHSQTKLEHKKEATNSPTQSPADTSSIQINSEDILEKPEKDIGIIPDIETDSSMEVFTRKTAPFNAKRIA